MSQTKAQLVSGTTAQDLTVDNINTTSINSGQTSGSKNLIINGAMQVAQRGTTSTESGMKTVDRFQVLHNGTDEAPTQAQVDVASGTTPYTLGFRKALRITNGNQTNGANSGDYIAVDNRIEAQDLANSGWNYTSSASYITLSFWIKSSVAQNFYVTLKSSDGTQQGYAFETGSLTANTWTKITHSISGSANLTFDNNSEQGLMIRLVAFRGTSKTSSGFTLNTWANFNNSNRMPDNTTTWYTTNDATLEITGYQLEVGSVATDFEHRSFAQELTLCQRYCCKWWNNGDTTANHSRFPVGHTNSTSSMAFWLQHPVPMRTTDGKTITHNIGQIQPINQGATQYNPSFTLAADGQQELISMIQLGLASGRTENQIAYFRVGGGQTNWYLIIANEL